MYIPRTEMGTYRPLLILGSPGTGKTAAALHLMPLHQHPNRVLAHIPLGDKDASSAGIYPVPYTDPKGQRRIDQVVSLDDIHKVSEAQIGDRPGLLILDDFTHADHEIQSCFLDAAQFHRFGNVKLGRNVLIVFTGNIQGDGTFARPITQALMSRCWVVRWRPNYKAWVDYESNLMVHPHVIGFLQAYPEWFAPDLTEPKFIDEIGKGASPRDWTALGLVMTEFGTFDRLPTSNLTPTAVDFAASMVGEKAAAQLNAWIRMNSRYPAVEMLWADPALWNTVPTHHRSSTEGIYALSHAMRGHAGRLLMELAAPTDIAKESAPKRKQPSLQSQVRVIHDQATTLLEAINSGWELHTWFFVSLQRILKERGQGHIAEHLITRFCESVADDPERLAIFQREKKIYDQYAPMES